MEDGKYNNGDQIDYGYQPQNKIYEGYQPIPEERGYQPNEESGCGSTDNPPSRGSSEAGNSSEE